MCILKHFNKMQCLHIELGSAFNQFELFDCEHIYFSDREGDNSGDVSNFLRFSSLYQFC